jgi:hypothetical protein
MAGGGGLRAGRRLIRAVAIGAAPSGKLLARAFRQAAGR